MNDVLIEQLIEKLDRFAHNNLSTFRYQHSCRVAAFAEYLAKRYSLSFRQQRICFLAGIAHDICKEQPLEHLHRLVQRDGNPVHPLEYTNTELLHGRAAAVVLRENYGITKKSLLTAVRYHTIGSAKFDAVGKILYIADKIEPGRSQCEDIRRKAATLPLEVLFLEVIDEVMAFVERKGRIVHPNTEKMYLFQKAKYENQRRKSWKTEKI